MKNNKAKPKTTDEYIAMFYIRHIQNPCPVETSTEINNIRHLHLNEAQEALPHLKDSYQKTALEKLVNYYLGTLSKN